MGYHFYESTNNISISRFIKISLTMILFVHIYTAAVFAVPGSSMDRAELITLTNNSASSSGSIDYSGDKDYFRINVAVRGTLTVASTGVTNVAGELLDSYGGGIQSNSGYNGSVNFQISRFVYEGTYYIKVTHTRSAGTGTYGISVSLLEPPVDDHGNSFSTATTIPVNSTTLGNIGVPGDNDYFRFDLTGNESILNVRTTGSTDTYGYLYMGGSGGYSLVDSNDNMIGNNFGIVRSVTAGTYYIQVKHYSSYGTGPYELKVDFGETPSDDHGNSIDYATPIDLNTQISGNIGFAQDVDYFKVTVTGKEGSIEVNAASNDRIIGQLLDANGRSIIGGISQDSTFRISKVVGPGEYYIRVNKEDRATGPYSLVARFTETPSDDHGYSIENATSVVINSTVSGSIGFSRDEDYFKIEVPENGTLTVFTSGTTDTYGYLLNSRGDNLNYNDNKSETDRNFNILQSVAPGTYFVRLIHRSGGTGEYVFTVQFTNAAVVDDHGDWIDSATDANINSVIDGSINYTGDNDYFRFSIPVKGTLTITSNGTNLIDGILQNGNGGSRVADTAQIGNNFNISVVLNPDTYLLKVSHRERGLGNYNISIRFEEAIIDDHGDSINNATQMGLGSVINGNIQFAGDNDFFRLDIPQNGTLTVKTRLSTNTYGYLLNSAGGIIAENDNADGLNFVINQEVTAGTYYIRVRHSDQYSNGLYTLENQFTPAIDDHGNSISNATAVGLNTSLNGSINPAGDVDFFKVTVPRTGTLTIYTTGSTDTYGYLLNSSGSSIAYNDDTIGRNFKITKSVSAGVYYVKVRHYSQTATGLYGLSVSFN